MLGLGRGDGSAPEAEAVPSSSCRADGTRVEA
jgi:hypothetical protein